MPYLLAPLSLAALGVLAVQSSAARVVFALATLGALMGIVGIRWPKHRRAPGILVLAGFVIAAFTAGFLAWVDALRGKRMAYVESHAASGSTTDLMVSLDFQRNVQPGHRCCGEATESLRQGAVGERRMLVKVLCNNNMQNRTWCTRLAQRVFQVTMIGGVDGGPDA